MKDPVGILITKGRETVCYYKPTKENKDIPGYSKEFPMFCKKAKKPEDEGEVKVVIKVMNGKDKVIGLINTSLEQMGSDQKMEKPLLNGNQSDD